MGNQRALNSVMWTVVTLKQLIHISDKWTSECGVQNFKESVAILVYTTDETTVTVVIVILVANDASHDCIMTVVGDFLCWDMVHLLFQYVQTIIPIFVEPSNLINVATKFT